MASSSPPPTPADFAMSSVATSTAASTPSPDEESDLKTPSDDTNLPNYFIRKEDMERRLARLDKLLETSSAYSSMLKIEMDKEKEKAALRSVSDKRKPGHLHLPNPKRARLNDEAEQSNTASTITQPKFRQPSLVTGAQLKDYQLDGVEWMVSLDKNGVSGILADEMGLGKTLQTIGFNAYLRELGNYKPFLIVCPLSVLHNWMEEFRKFAPEIPVCMYHGSPTDRAELRGTVMRKPDYDDDTVPTENQPVKKNTSRRPADRKSIRTRSKSKPSIAKSPRSDAKEQSTGDDDRDTITPTPQSPRQTRATFPVVVTTYEIIIKDRIHLARYEWGYIVVDEGHRLKNLDCKLMQEIKKYPSAGRMILTGTPLHNNLAELWSLLNFILPDIFSDLDAFQEWFNLGELQSQIAPERYSQLINTLHGILKPFLLRRLKAEVEINLPPKKEYVLYAPLSVQQHELYDKVIGGGLRAFLIGSKEKTPPVAKVQEIDLDAPKKLRGKRKRYDEHSDDEYFEMLEDGTVGKVQEQEEDEQNIGRQYQYKASVKQVNNMKLQNAVMQLRKVCSHPFLFDWPVDPKTREPILNEDLVHASGKMMILDRLLTELFRRKHKVLLFSQFTTMLDIIQDWATEFKQWSICRIDGSTPQIDRRSEMNRFQLGGDDPGAPRLFLLSTRAGGLGINLTAADTVIFYDQDWNPQMDVQAQDRAHRIGQTKPVLIFRLVSAHTIETKIMHRATEKRKLEALVIAKGKFKMPGSNAATKNKQQTIAEMAASLLKLEGENIQVVSSSEAGGASLLSDEDLEMLLDRSNAVFADRGKGWTSYGVVDNAGQTKEIAPGRKRAAFAVYDAPVEQGNNVLAQLMGEDEAA